MAISGSTLSVTYLALKEAIIIPALDAIEILFLGGLLGLFGQGARALVGLSTLANYANAPEPSQSNVFNAARLAVSLIIGILTGIAAALAFVIVGRRAANLSVNALLEFAGTGYIGTDIIEVFIKKYFDKTSPTALKQLSTQSGGVSMEAFSSLLDTFAEIQKKLPAATTPTPQLTHHEILAFLTTKLYPPTNIEKWKVTDPLPDKEDAEAVLNEIGDLFATKGIKHYTLSSGDLDGIEQTYSALATAIGNLFHKLGGTYLA